MTWASLRIEREYMHYVSDIKRMTDPPLIYMYVYLHIAVGTVQTRSISHVCHDCSAFYLLLYREKALAVTGNQGAQVAMDW